MRPLRVLLFSSPASEKLLHQRATFILQHAGADLNPVIQKIRVANSKATHHRACSFVRRTVNQTSDPRLYQSTRAHRARLDRRVNIHAAEPVVAELAGSFAERDDFSVGCGVAVGARAVSGDSDEFVFADDARSDRNFAAFPRCAGGGQSLLHPVLVRICLKQRTATIGRTWKQCQGNVLGHKNHTKHAIIGFLEFCAPVWLAHSIDQV